MYGGKALLAIDVMNGIFNLPLPLYKEKMFLENLVKIISKAHEKKVLVIFLMHQGEKGSPFERGTRGQELHPLLDKRDGDIIIEKRHSDSFRDTDLEKMLKEFEINELYICGFCTEGCVDETLRAANRKNFNVTLITDCHTTTDNQVLTGEKTVEYHNLLSERFAKQISSKHLTF